MDGFLSGSVPDIKDSNFHNYLTTVKEMLALRNRPKVRGFRNRNSLTEEDYKSSLNDDMQKIMTSPMNQLENAEPVPGMSSDTISAIRALHSVLLQKDPADDEIEQKLALVVDLLHGVEPTTQVPEQEEMTAEKLTQSENELFVPEVRRSKRLMERAPLDYNEEKPMDDMYQFLQDDGEDEGEDLEMEDLDMEAADK